MVQYLGLPETEGT